MNLPTRLALTALPLLGLGAVWQTTATRTARGSEWLVPVTGYDPRDLLKGHYVQFQYQWPASDTSIQQSPLAPAKKVPTQINLCLIGAAPELTATRLLPEDQAATLDCGAVIRPAIGSGIPKIGRLYVSEIEATRLQIALSNPKQQATLRFRLSPNGAITPLGLSFAPK